MKGNQVFKGHIAILLLSAVVFIGTPAYGQAPVVVSAPVSQAVVSGGNVVLEVSVTGELPITYKWWRDYSPNSPFYTVTLDSTNCVLVLTNVTASTAATYGVRAENAQGFSARKLAAVSVIAPNMETNGFSLTIRGITNTTWRIEYCTNYSSPNWLVLTNFAFPLGPPIPIKIQDWEATNGSRFYRVIPTFKYQ